MNDSTAKEVAEAIEEEGVTWFSSWFDTEHGTFMAEECTAGRNVFYPNSSVSVFFQAQAQGGNGNH